MTIVVGIGSSDGLILASDSRTTHIRGDDHRIGTDAAEKMFILHDADGSPQYGLATYGAAFIGKRTINGLIDEFVASVGRNVPIANNVEEFATALGEFFHKRFVEDRGEDKPGPPWALGFILAGYDDAGIGHLWEINIPGPKVELTEVNTPDRGALFRGQTGVIGRLIKGVDRAALEAAEIEFAPEVDGRLDELEYPVQHPVALQDAADMAAFVVRTTIDMQRFFSGAKLSKLLPGCGGPIQMIAVTRSGAEWVARRPLTAP